MRKEREEEVAELNQNIQRLTLKVRELEMQSKSNPEQERIKQLEAQLCNVKKEFERTKK